MFAYQFQEAAPRKATLLDCEKRAFELGSMLDQPRSGRRTSRNESCAEAVSSVDRSPQKLIRKRATELGLLRTTLHDHNRRDLLLKPYRPSLFSCAELFEEVPSLMLASLSTSVESDQRRKEPQRKIHYEMF